MKWPWIAVVKIAVATPPPGEAGGVTPGMEEKAAGAQAIRVEPVNHAYFTVVIRILELVVLRPDTIRIRMFLDANIDGRLVDYSRHSADHLHAGSEEMQPKPQSSGTFPTLVGMAEPPAWDAEGRAASPSTPEAARNHGDLSFMERSSCTF